LLRLTFARRTPHSARRWVFLGAGHKESDGGLSVTPQLEAIYQAPHPGRGVFALHGDPRLLQGALASCLRRLQTPGGLVRAACRVDNGLYLALSGRVPWAPAAGQTPNGLDGWLGRHRLADSGLKVDEARREFRLRPTSPEATIRLSAALACGDRLELWARAGANRGRLFVELHDFDGDETELPVLACYHRGEKWLRGVPPLHLELSEEDVIALAAWAYLPEDWLDLYWDWREEEVLDRILDARDALADLVKGTAQPSPA
jgi:hypothetical protein